MNFITEDMLEELASPSRIFRTDSTMPQSPRKQQAIDRFLNKSLLTKRESMCFDDFPNPARPDSDGFFIEVVAMRAKDDAEKETGEALSKRSSVPEEVADAKVINVKAVFTQTTKEVSEFSVVNEKIEVVTTELATSTEIMKVAVKEVECKIVEAEPQPKAQINNSPTFETDDIKTPPVVDKPARKLSKTEPDVCAVQNIKRRKASTLTNERNLIRSRIAKVGMFWRGDNTYIPSVFRTLMLVKEPTKHLVEFQDFSLKGLSHGIDGQNSEAKVTTKLQGKDDEDEYFYDDFEGPGMDYPATYLD